MDLKAIVAKMRGRSFDTKPVKRVLNGATDRRPYATRNGFYVGDRVEVAPSGYIGHITTVYGSDSNRCRVGFSDGGGKYVSDEQLTRLGDE